MLRVMAASAFAGLMWACVTTPAPTPPPPAEGSCAPGQELREEKYAGGRELRARGCVGKNSEGNYRLEGLWSYFYKDGAKEAEGEYRAGNAAGERGPTGILLDGRHGTWVMWHPNGQKASEATLRDGKTLGVFTKWHPNGQKASEVTFRDGKPEGVSKAWHPNGQKSWETTYRDGNLEGAAFGWHSNGQKSIEGSFRGGKPDGQSTSWHPNGQKEEEATYRDGKYEGVVTKWDEKGVETVQTWRDGRCVSGCDTAEPEGLTEVGRACRRKDVEGCRGFALGLGLGGKGASAADIAAAIDLMRQRCEEEGAHWCSWLGAAYIGGAVPYDYDAAARAFRLGCSKDEPVSCANLARVIRAGKLRGKTEADAVLLDARACELGHEDSCPKPSGKPGTK